VKKNFAVSIKPKKDKTGVQLFLGYSFFEARYIEYEEEK